MSVFLVQNGQRPLSNYSDINISIERSFFDLHGVTDKEQLSEEGKKVLSLLLKCKPLNVNVLLSCIAQKNCGEELRSIVLELEESQEAPDQELLSLLQATNAIIKLSSINDREKSLLFFSLLLGKSAEKIKEEHHFTEGDLSEFVFLAARSGHLQMLRMLKTLGADVNARDLNKMRPVHHAVVSGQTEALRTLKELGANLNVFESNRLTPLHLSLMRKDGTEVFKTLLELNANLRVAMAFSSSLSCLAASNGQVEALKILKERTVSFNRGSKTGWKNPVDYAAENGQVEASKVLKEWQGVYRTAQIEKKTPVHVSLLKGLVAVVTLQVFSYMGMVALQNYLQGKLFLR